MRQSKRIVVLIGVVALTLIGQGIAALAQDAGSPTTRPGGPGGGRPRFDPQQFTKMLTDRLKEQMGATDEEWAAIEPRIVKVMDAQLEAGGAGIGMGMRMLFGGGGPGGPGAEDESKLSSTAKAARDLQAAIAANAGPNELTAKMTAYRDAQANARKQLAEARQSLKELLTHKQEALLLMVGILD